jgi:nicotinamidase-related amidase
MAHDSPGATLGLRFALERDQAALLVIDVQERLGKAMDPERYARVLQNTRTLVKGANVLGLPVFVTEQYPKGLGPTEPSLAELLAPESTPVEKLAFSCGAVKEVARRLYTSGRKQILVAGMETHVCVFQTVRDLVAGGYQPFVARDATLARTPENHELGLTLMREAGATISSTETMLFDLLGEAGTPEFKQIAPLLK